MLQLQGVGILVTRPSQQAMPLCQLLEASGAVVFRLPAIDIKPAADVADLKRRLAALAPFDLTIFTSANAVRFGAALIEGPSAPLAAIGSATARALAEAGHRVTVTPTRGFDSEGLLLHPALARPAGQRVLLVKGMHGRDLLQAQLTRRGAHVIVADVYQRVRAEHGAVELAALAARFADDDIHVVTATSAEIAGHLLDMATPVLRRQFEQVQWLVPSARIAGALRERGVRAPILQAETADNQSLVAAVIRWRSRVSGA